MDYGFMFEDNVDVTKGSAQQVLAPVIEGFDLWMMGYFPHMIGQPVQAAVWKINTVDPAQRPEMLSMNADDLTLGGSTTYYQKITLFMDDYFASNWKASETVLRIGDRHYRWWEER